MLLREVLVEEPFKYRPGSKERGISWQKTAENLQESGIVLFQAMLLLQQQQQHFQQKQQGMKITMLNTLAEIIKKFNWALQLIRDDCGFETAVFISTNFMNLMFAYWWKNLNTEKCIRLQFNFLINSASVFDITIMQL